VATLRNPRHERFAQELATGKSADAAYGLAGYRENRSNAARLSANEDIQRRVAEIQSVGAELAAITVETLIAEAEAARSKAMREKGGAGAAIAAITTRFPILALSQGCAVAIAFTVRHPERVSHLVLYGGFAVGRMKRPTNTDADRERFAAMAALMRLGWGGDDPTFRQIFTSQLIPTATRQQADAFNELQRKSASPECAVRYYETLGNIDVRSLLPRVATPTLVIHVRDDVMVPAELGREIAAGIPGAKFVLLPGKNHILLEGDPGLPKLFEEVQRFLKG
jgi:alpha-beta hydrolase superfamily lysophospholipase